MVPSDHGSDGSWQEDGSGGDSSSQHSPNDVPAYSPNYPHDQSLTGSGSHVPQPQESGQTSFIHAQNYTLPSYSQYCYGYQTPQGGVPLSGPWPGGFRIDRLQETSQVINTQTGIDMTQYYPSPQPTQGDASTRNGPYPTDRSSPFYPMPPQVDITSQAANHLQQGVQYSSDRRSSLQPLYSPTPRQSINFFPLPSPPRSNSSYSRSETSSVQPGQSMSRRTSFQWPVPHDQSNRSVSNPSSVTHPHNDADSQSPSYPHLVNSFGNSGQALDPTLYAWPPSYLGEVPPQHTLPYPPNDGPPFPASQSSQPAPAKRKRVTRSNPYPRSGQQTEKQVSPPDDPPVASSSRVRLDMLPPAPAHGEGSNFKATAKERDAKRKRGDRASKGCWKERLADLLPASQPRPKKLLEILDAVIKYFGGDPLEVVDQPCEPEKKYDSPKSRLNSIRRNNERRGYERIREILQAWGYHVTSATSRINILQIVVYMLEMENGTVSEDLIKLIDKFSGQDPGAPGP